MANRYAWGDTLGAQLYGRSLQSLAAERERQRLLEEERQRREAEIRRQEEQRKKASDHGAFGQTLQTIGQVGGAIVGGMYGGTPGAIAGSQLGSAGASTIMNLFPNVGGTEPDGSNPYYNKPSDMARLGSTINTGLQAYGMYSKAAAAEEQKKFTQKVTADIADQTKRFREGDTSAFNYYGATPTEIQKHIETNISGWDDAKGFFGDKLLNSDVSLSMANTIHQNMMSRLGQQMQFANSLTDTSEKQQVFTNLERLYGQNYSDFIPEGGSDAIRAGIQSRIEDAATKKSQDDLTFSINYAGKVLSNEQAAIQLTELKQEIANKPKKEAEAKYLQLAELGLKAIQAGAPYDPTVFEASGNVSPELKSQVSALASAYATSYSKAETAKTQQQTREAAEQTFKLTMDVMKNVPWEAEPLRQQLALGATKDPQLQQLLSLLGPKKEGDSTDPASPYSTQTKAAAQAKYLFYSKGGGEFDEIEPQTDEEIKAKVLREDPNSAVTKYIVEEIIGDKANRQAAPEAQNNLIDQEASKDNSKDDPMSPDVLEALSSTGLPFVDQTADNSQTSESPTVQAAAAQGVDVNASTVEPVPDNSPTNLLREIAASDPKLAQAIDQQAKALIPEIRKLISNTEELKAAYQQEKENYRQMINTSNMTDQQLFGQLARIRSIEMFIELVQQRQQGQ